MSTSTAAASRMSRPPTPDSTILPCGWSTTEKNSDTMRHWYFTSAPPRFSSVAPARTQRPRCISDGDMRCSIRRRAARGSASSTSRLSWKKRRGKRKASSTALDSDRVPMASSASSSRLSGTIPCSTDGTPAPCCPGSRSSWRRRSRSTTIVLSEQTTLSKAVRPRAPMLLVSVQRRPRRRRAHLQGRRRRDRCVRSSPSASSSP
mmetsp:Transcript_93709/g.264505  ORF Transcript_93709/g.264505 Transcript_93709/m.264505 type:complete len:205 (-) Transcript_93709:1340-1954(-)